MTTPLRTPGDFKSTSALKQLIPINSTVSSFFLYDGAIELALAQLGRGIIAHTHKPVVYEFWVTLKNEKNKVAAAVEEFYPKIDSVLFHHLQESWAHVGTPITRSALFFLLNRCSKEGMVSTGAIDKSYFNPLALNYLKNFDGTNFYPVLDNNANPLEAIFSAKQTEFILLPVGKFNYNLFEYGKSRGYDMTSINHQELHEMAQQIEKKWIILYKPHARVYEMYKNYNIRLIDKYGRDCSKKDDAEELLIANF